MLGEEGIDALGLEEKEIAEGDAAAMAYGRLQFEDLSEQNRKKIESALLRYCELYTLAMVIVVNCCKFRSKSFLSMK